MDQITVSSSLISPQSDRPLTPAMLSVLWEIGALLDETRAPKEAKDAVWLETATARLRGETGRSDNVWLRECLERFLGLKIGGVYKGDPWGAVIVAEYQFTQGGSAVRILIPPAAIRAIRAPEAFAKIEVDAVHRLPPHARKLYAILADKKRQRQTWWVYDLEDLKVLLGVGDKKAYDRWGNFSARVLDPAVAAINDFGTVDVKMTPLKMGRSFNRVRFDWTWKTLDQARETAEENARHSGARGKTAPGNPDAPPLVRDQTPEAIAAWKRKMGLLPD